MNTRRAIQGLSRVHLDYATRALHGDHALLELLKERARVRDASHVQHWHRFIVGDDLNVANAEDAIEEVLMEAKVFHMPKFESVDVLGEQAAFVIDAIVGDAVANRFCPDNGNQNDNEADDDK